MRSWGNGSYLLGLTHLCSHHVLHRDIKEPKVLLTDSIEVKTMDKNDSESKKKESRPCSGTKEVNQQSSKMDSCSPAPTHQDKMEESDLPQLQMGQTKVDDMRFMITCTNWY